MSKKRKKKRRLQLRPRLTGIRRPDRLENARQWLATYQGTDSLGDYERRYGVDHRCAIAEMRQLGMLSEQQEAEIREELARRAQVRAEKRARKAAKQSLAAKARAERKRAAKARAAEQRAAKQRAGEERAARRRTAESDGISMAEAHVNALIEGWYDEDEEADSQPGWVDESFEVGPDPAPDIDPDWRGEEEHWSLEDALFEESRDLDLRVTEVKTEVLERERMRVRLAIEADPEVLAKRAWGLIFAIAALSFRDADADLDFAECDAWTVGDMLRCLSFERGRLRFHAESVRGRCMNTTIEVDAAGKITLETTNRGEAAVEWMSWLEAGNATSVVAADRCQEEIPF